MLRLIALVLLGLDFIGLTLWSLNVPVLFDMNHIVGIAIIAGVLGVFDGYTTRSV